MTKWLFLLCLIVSACAAAKHEPRDYIPTGGTITKKYVSDQGHMALAVNWCDAGGQCYENAWEVSAANYYRYEVGQYYGDATPKLVLMDCVAKSDQVDETLGRWVISIISGMVFFLVGRFGIIPRYRRWKNRLPRAKVVS